MLIPPLNKKCGTFETGVANIGVLKKLMENCISQLKKILLTMIFNLKQSKIVKCLKEIMFPIDHLRIFTYNLYGCIKFLLISHNVLRHTFNICKHV